MPKILIEYFRLRKISKDNYPRTGKHLFTPAEAWSYASCINRILS